MTTARPRLTRDADVARRATEKRVPSSETDLKRPPTTAGASRNTWRAARRPVRPLVEIAGSGVPPEAVRPALPQNGKHREEQRPQKGRRLPPNVSKASTHHERYSSSSWQTSPARRLRARPRSLTNPPNASSRGRTTAHHDTKSAPSTQGEGWTLESAVESLERLARLAAERVEDARDDGGADDARDVRAHRLHEDEVRRVVVARDLV